MRQLIVSAACLALIACGSTSDSGAAAAPTAEALGIARPDTSLLQLVGPEQLNWEAGLIEMKYALRIHNNAADPITLRQIQIKTVGQEGPYYVPPSSYFFREAINAGAARDVEFFAKAHSGGDRYRIDAQSPVAIRIIAYFETSGGNFRQTFITNLGQSFKE